VNYDVEWEQKATTLNGQKIEPMHSDAQVHEIVQGACARMEKTEHTWSEHQKEASPSVHSISATNGKLLYEISGDSGTLDTWNNQPLSGLTPSYRDFLLATQTQPRTDQSPDLLSLLNDPQTRLLDEPAAVNGHSCCVLETRTSQPLYMTRQSRSTATTRAEQRTTVNTQPTPIKYADHCEIRRVTLDPSMDFMPVRLTVDSQLIADSALALSSTQRSEFEKPWRVSETSVTKGLKTQCGVWVPQEATITTFRNAQTVHTVAHVRVSTVALNQPHAASEFVLTFPVGCRVYDGIRHIGYQVGESQVVIQGRVAKRAEEDQFFAGILGKSPPQLKARNWLVGQPLRLEDLKGRPVIIHFWNIWCGPCVHEIPQLQQSYGRQIEQGLVFISIHTGGDESDRAQIEKFIKDNGITFPVMWDASDPTQKGWGSSSEAYGVYAIPTDALIDVEGRLQSVGDHRLH
jgi:thiol-disulfide isomerase/thioredoxin